MIDGCFWALQQMISCYDLQTQPIILLLAIEGTIWGSSLEPTYSFGFKMLNGSCWKKDSSDSSSFTLHPLSDQKLQNTTYLQFLFCGLQHNLLQTGGLLFIWRNTWTQSQVNMNTRECFTEIHQILYLHDCFLKNLTAIAMPFWSMNTCFMIHRTTFKF